MADDLITKKITEVQNFANGDLGTIIQVQGDEIGQTNVSTLKQDITNSVVTELTESGGVSLNLVNPIDTVPTYADLALITPTPNVNDAYQVEADGLVYVYTENGFQAEGEGFKVQPNVNGIVEEGNAQAVSGGEVWLKNQEIRRLSDDSNLYEFLDEQERVIAHITENGELETYVTEKTKNEINNVKFGHVEGYIYALIDDEDKIIFGIKDDGSLFGYIPNIGTDEGNFNKYNSIPYDFNNGTLEISYLVDLNSNLNFPSIAVGRNTSEGIDDAPKIPLTTSGYTHPSVFFLPSGWNGFSYWMAITPTFGIIAEQPNPASFENPHIFCSNDGITWQEPIGINNPIDLPPPSPSLGYWSDTHLMLLPDGHLYCIYRGNGIVNSRLGISEFPNEIKNLRADVYKRSKDGINWEDVEFIQGTTNQGINSQGGIMSPAFVFDNGYINCFDVVWSTPEYPYSGEGQSNRVVMRRILKELNEFKNLPYSQKNVVNFKNSPWPANHSVWHLDGCKWGNTWFLLLNTSQNDLDTGSDLYLAYSGDGWNFNVIEQPINTVNSYRSCIVPISSNESEISFHIYSNVKPQGVTSLKKIKLKYKK